MWGLRAMVGGLLLASLVAAAVGGWSEWARDTSPFAPVQAVGSTVVGLSWAVIGGVLAWLRPKNSLGWLMLLVGFITQVGLSEEAVAHAGGFGVLDESDAWAGRPVGLIVSLLAGFAIYVMIGLLPMLYPTGKLPSRVWRWPGLAVVVGAALLQAQWLIEQGAPASEPTVLSLSSVLVYAGGTLTGWVLGVFRLVRARYPERQQLAWLLVTVVALILTQFLGSTPEALWAQLPFLYLLPVAIAIGILKYKLLGIETVLRRGLVYGVLTALVLGLYAAVSVAAGVQLTGAALPAVVAAGLVAVGLTPLSAWLQRVVDRLLYGQRGDPIRAVTELGIRVAGTRDGQLLDVVLEGVRDSVRARGARIRDDDGRILATAGESLENYIFSAELSVGSSPVGSLDIASRGPRERYSSRDERMLMAMVPQVAAVVRALQLADDLEEQRDAVVVATRRERDRLRRDLHDGLGPSLTGVGLGLRALADALDADDQKRAVMISDVLRGEIADAVVEVRQILDDLGPVALTEDSLGEALRSQVATMASHVPVELRIGELPPMSAGVEATVYRVVGEAVNNAIRHANASLIVVEVLIVDSELLVCVTDDGDGFPTPSQPGIGLQSMTERANDLGGQLTVESSDAGASLTLSVPMGVRVP